MKRRWLLPIVALVLLSCRVALPGQMPSATRAPTAAAVVATQPPEATDIPEPTSTSEPTATETAAQTVAAFPPLNFGEGRDEQDDAKSHTTIKLHYPTLQTVQQTNAYKFNDVMQWIVNASVEDFKKAALDAAQFPSDVSGSFMELDYEMFYNQNGLASLQLGVLVYIKGAAHPYHYTVPVNYDFRGGRELTLADVFQPGSQYLALLSTLCTADLQKRDIPLFIEGAQPKPDNYRSWNLTPQGLRITFDPYQVAAYAAGPQIVNLEWAALQGMVASDLGLPLP